MKSPIEEKLVSVPFGKTIPDVSWYRHTNWPAGEYKRFRHEHTMSSNANQFEFFNDSDDIKALNEAGKLDPEYFR